MPIPSIFAYSFCGQLGAVPCSIIRQNSPQFWRKRKLFSRQAPQFLSLQSLLLPHHFSASGLHVSARGPIRTRSSVPLGGGTMTTFKLGFIRTTTGGSRVVSQYCLLSQETEHKALWAAIDCIVSPINYGRFLIPSDRKNKNQVFYSKWHAES